MAMIESPAHDARFMAAAIRYAERHRGLTGTNPSVACLIVKDDEIIGRGITAIGGRPHAEAIALSESGTNAKGATAYVTLEPCAHHGRTPPCAQALINAKICRVVGAASDPDPRVAGRGYQMLRDAGIDVVENVLANQAADRLSAYLNRTLHKRPEVIVKMALSADNKIGIANQRIAITNAISNAQVHLLRSEVDLIAVGAGTLRADNPSLTCRLHGLGNRSPKRLIIAPEISDLGEIKTHLLSDRGPQVLWAGGGLPKEFESKVERLAVAFHGSHVALPELLDDLGALGHASLLVEGGAGLVQSFLSENLVDRIMLYRSDKSIGEHGISAPITPENIPSEFALIGQALYGNDQFFEWSRRR